MAEILIAGGWLAIWLGVAAGRTAKLDGDRLVRALGALLPAFAATTCLGAFVLHPHRAAATRLVTLWAHHASFIALFAFLLAAQFLQIEAWWKRRLARPVASISNTYDRLWVLTELCPGAIAATILLTGLRLIWESPNVDYPAQAWLAMIMILFGFFSFDGVAGFTPIVRTWRTRWRTAAEAGQAPRSDRWGEVGDCVQLFVHFASWPAVFLLGLKRYDPPNWVSAWLAGLGHDLAFLPTGWGPVVIALSMWASTGAAVVGARMIVWRLGSRPT